MGKVIKLIQKGDWTKSNKYLERLLNVSATLFAAGSAIADGRTSGMFDRYGQLGVDALSSVTPVDSGKTASSWYYEVKRGKERTTISFHNSHINDGVPIAIILQYGHGTGTGGWVEGRDYINPAIQPIFDAITEEAWKEVTRL